MNPRLELLKPYPFERLNELLAGVTPPALPYIALSLGEPKHPAPAFVVEKYAGKAEIEAGFGTYPPTAGLPELRSAIAQFANRRYGLDAQPVQGDSHVLPVNGTREALFAFAQAVIGSKEKSITLLPNPFYQIYEGAVLLAGSEPVYVPCHEENDFAPDFTAIEDDQWERCELVYICTPGNPSGNVMTIDQMQELIRLSDRYDFVIASDECYSEIYADENNPPPGLLQAAAQMGRKDYKNCMVFNSLSKRSNLPGLRSGFVCGDENLISKFLLYRTYHGSAMSVHNQWASVAAWQDEEHVKENRKLYRQKFDAVLDILDNVWPMSRPEASFYLWPATPIDDPAFAKSLFAKEHIKVLPGSYLSREVGGFNPGAGRVRMALVATVDECVEAAERLKRFMQDRAFE
ncbi:MAG: succinyldiaminopimelate transaminase [Pseudomonadales bacterium]|nr:succinyldiaminopimelate transaminase [Pseudomonadales bacterium]